MKVIRTIVLTTLLTAPLVADQHEQPKAKFDEIFKLVGEHLVGADEDDINAAAVGGLIDRLHPRVQLNPRAPDPDQEIELITQTNRFNREFGYVRIANVEDGLASATIDAIREMLKNGPLRGIVLDLRFAEGASYRAAANVAGLFADDTPALVKVANKEYRAATGGEAIRVPTMILINQRTSGSAEAVAAVLRELKAGLLIGTKTAGTATVFEDFELATGDTLRVATEPVQISGGAEIPVRGISPDIEIKISLVEEQAYMMNPFRETESTNRDTNGIASRRVTEADLVRQRKEGGSLDQIISDRQRRDNKLTSVVTDPALARALDLLTALSVVENWGDR